MGVVPATSKIVLVFAGLAIMVPASVIAQDAPETERKDIVVIGQQAVPATDPALPAGELPKGPDIKGIISARSGNRIQITDEKGGQTIIAVNQFTRIKSNSGLFSRAKLDQSALLNGLPVTIKTLQAGDRLLASQISLRNTDLKTANMIRSGTAQGFAEQRAATEALRGRMGDIDQYNIKGTTNVNFETGKAVLSAQGKADLCATTTTADGMKKCPPSRGGLYRFSWQ